MEVSIVGAASLLTSILLAPPAVTLITSLSLNFLGTQAFTIHLRCLALPPPRSVETSVIVITLSGEITVYITRTGLTLNPGLVFLKDALPIPRKSPYQYLATD